MTQLKRIRQQLLGIGLLIASVNTQAVDLNLASHIELESIRGIGPKMTERIIEERTTHGPFTSWIDFAARVKGVGNKKLITMQKDNLTLKGFPVEFDTNTTPTKAPTTNE